MALYKTEGIILKRINFGEADRILTIFTKTKGKIKVVTRGIRRSKAKMAGHVERFNRVNLMIAEGKNLDVLSGAQLVQPFEYNESLEVVAKAYYMSELVDELVHDELPHEEVYQLIIEFLDHVGLGNKLIVPYFEVNLLDILGFRPEVNNCVICHERLELGKSVLVVDHGGFAHSHCLQGEIVDDDIIKVLRLFLESNIGVIEKLNLSNEVIKNLQFVISQFVVHQTGKELKSQSFLHEISNHS